MANAHFLDIGRILDNFAYAVVTLKNFQYCEPAKNENFLLILSM